MNFVAHAEPDEHVSLECIVNLGPLYETVGESPKPVRHLALSRLTTTSGSVARHGGSLSELDAARSKSFSFPLTIEARIPDPGHPAGRRPEPRRYILEVRAVDGMSWGDVLSEDQIVVTCFREELPAETPEGDSGR